MTPRLAPSTFAPRRTTAKQRKGARAWLGPLCVAASLAAHGVLLVLVIPDPNDTPPADAIAEQPTVLDDVAVTVLPQSALEPEPTPV
ncbi:hypothetical protein IQ273_20735, partial [Nodosilinea sp. LEGE 07298]|uniref:hypothetical protein n=1 Tax=Nodosilinea sp. LEGE 07298 TaxID=2777970 RepID=UPI00187EB7CE